MSSASSAFSAVKSSRLAVALVTFWLTVCGGCEAPPCDYPDRPPQENACPTCPSGVCPAGPEGPFRLIPTYPKDQRPRLNRQCADPLIPSSAHPFIPSSRCELSPSDVPFSIRQQNYVANQRRLKRPEGSCLYASMATALRWQGEWDLAERMTGYAGGQSFRGLAEVCRADGVQFAATLDGDEWLLHWCDRTRRIAAIHYGDAHAVCFAGFDPDTKQAILIDSNRASFPIRVPREAFFAEWHRSGGEALVPIYTPSPDRAQKG